MARLPTVAAPGAKVLLMSNDAIVVGGGIMGLSVAYELATSGTRVMSIYPEAGAATAASYAAGAMLGAFGEVTVDDDSNDDIELAFRVGAQRTYPEWLNRLTEHTGSRIPQSRGTFVIANNESGGDRPALRRMRAQAERVGEPHESVEPEDVPGFRPSPRYVPTACLYLPNEHSVDSGVLLGALESARRLLPDWNYLDARATSVVENGERWRVLDDRGAVHDADHVVLAAGARSLTVLGDTVRVRARLPEMLLGKGVSCIVRGDFRMQSTIRTPNRAFACGIHVVPRGSDRLYIGATNCLSSDLEMKALPHPGELHNLFDEIIHQINLDVRDAVLESTRVGFRPIPSHRRPIVGPTSLPGLHVATGTYRNGILMAPSVSRIVASGVRSEVVDVINPYGTFGPPDLNLLRLVKIGIRDIIAFMQEPRSPLPYNRAAELTDYVTTLFSLALGGNKENDVLRAELLDELERAPYNETMHRLFYRIVERETSGSAHRPS